MSSANTIIDDCWNRIGDRGDRSCPKLIAHTRCLNCPIFAGTAARLLDRPLSDADLSDAARAAPQLRSAPDVSAPHAAAQSVLAFRIADEWLALPTAVLRQVDDPRPIHPLPHRRNRTILGLVNVLGTLTIAASLSELLQLDLGGDGRRVSRNSYPRLLVAVHRDELTAFPVDEVEGVLHFPPDAMQAAPATLTHACGVFAWRDATLSLLDTDRLFDSLARSLR
jgi:chemotaxis-related protein WspD